MMIIPEKHADVFLACFVWCNWPR